MLNSVTSTPPSELAKQKGTQSTQNQVNSNYAYAPDWMFESSNTGNVGDNLQVSASNNDAAQTAATDTGSILSDKCDDGKDDGKIGIGSAIVSMGKGALKSIVNTVKGIVTDPKKLLLTAGTVVACTLFPPLAVGLGVVGAVTGVVKGAQAVGQAVDLYQNGGTDAEAKAAFEDIGASALQVGVSVAGVKAGMNAMKATQGSAMSNLTKSSQTGLKGAVENGTNTLKAFAKDTVSGGRGFTTNAEGAIQINTANSGYKATQIVGNLKTSATNVLKEGAVNSAVNAAKGAHTTVSSAATSAGKAALHPIATAKAGVGAYSNFAHTAGYSSFGALTAPLAKEIQDANQITNYEQVQAQKTVSSSKYTSGQYQFSHDWMDKI